METAIIILSILAILQFVINCYFGSIILKNFKPKKNLKNKSQKGKDFENEFAIGDKVIFKSTLKYEWKSGVANSFIVNFEATVVEFTNTRLKIDPYKISGIEDAPKELLNTPNYESILLKFKKNQWIDSKGVEIIFDKDSNRDKKLNQILGNDL